MADVTITATNVVPPNASTTIRATPSNVICGEAIAAGETVCLLAADSKYYRGDANDADKRNIKGIAGNSAVVAGQRIDVITQSPALEIGTHGQAVGTPLFQSPTPGKLCPYGDLSTGALPVLMAYASTATAIQVLLATATTPKP